MHMKEEELYNNNEIIFEGEYLNGERLEKEKNIMKVV